MVNPVLVGMLIFVAAAAYLAFPRQVKNKLIAIFQKKRYVVCHLKHANTDYETIYNVVPDSDKLTQVAEKNYMLHPQYAVMKWKGRLHFILDEFDSIPKHLSTADNDILFQSHEIQDALNNDVVNNLFTRKKEIMIFILIVVVATLMIALIYTVFTLNKTLPYLDALLAAQQTVRGG